ncbi:hypothetical protein CRUP_007013, partial [Coryphaenoides rupestris]
DPAEDDCEEDCIFCLISQDQDEYTEVIIEDDELVCFRDIEPAAPHHYLVIPREHIDSCLSLTKKHVCLGAPAEDDCEEDCIFCLISQDQVEYTEVIVKDDELVCFRDIEPAAPHHYLVIPREHIDSCLSLTKKHVCLVEKMVKMGKAVLRAQGITDMQDIRLGFHRPPFTSVQHLHLHVLAPASEISRYMLHKF